MSGYRYLAMQKSLVKPKPVFDTIDYIIAQYKECYNSDNSLNIISKWLDQCYQDTDIKLPDYSNKDYKYAIIFLYSYRGSKDTFNSYRRDLERFLQWSWLVRKQSVLDLKRADIEEFINFCTNPPKNWISTKKVAKFKIINGCRKTNPDWLPFEVYVSKSEHKANIKPDIKNYKLSGSALKVLFGVLSSFYNFLLQEEVSNVNPVALIRQKSKFIIKDDDIKQVRRLSNEQWQAVINLVKKKATKDNKHERAVFILSCLYGMYLRISELVATQRWIPTMGDFFKDQNGNWWFTTVSKGNKARRIAVSDSMLAALKHYRVNYLGLPAYPTLGEKTPLISHLSNHNKHISSDRPIRRLVQEYFDLAAEKLINDNKLDEAEALKAATVHWLRHTGISDDVKIRPREHVRDDAGHSSGAITDKYIDVELTERAKSAKHKDIVKI